MRSTRELDALRFSNGSSVLHGKKVCVEFNDSACVAIASKHDLDFDSLLERRESLERAVLTDEPRQRAARSAQQL